MHLVAGVVAMVVVVVLGSAHPASAQQAGGGRGRGGPAGGSSAGGGPGGGMGAGSGGAPGRGFGGAPPGSSGAGPTPGPGSPDGSSSQGPGPEPSSNADADLVSGAIANGQSVPFNQVLATVENAYAGQIVGVNVSRRPPSGLAYAVKVLSDDGTLHEVTVDARSGTITAVR